jgi:hypothetical protein
MRKLWKLEALASVPDELPHRVAILAIGISVWSRLDLCFLGEGM